MKMLRNILVLAFCFVWGLLFLNCSDNQLAGRGAASETTNGEISGVLLLHEEPAAGRVVELRKLVSESGDWVVGRDTTDEEGAFAIEVEQPGRYLLWSLSDSSGLNYWVSLGKDVYNAGALNLTRLISLKGRVQGAGTDSVLENFRITLAGLDKEVDGKDSSFVLSGLPEGAYLVQVRGDSSVVAEVLVEDEGSSDTAFLETISVSEVPSVLIDDFEGPEGFSALHSLLGASWWGMWNDTAGGQWMNTAGLNTDSSAFSGKSLHAVLYADSGNASDGARNSAGLQIKLGGEEELDSNLVWYDLRNVDSLNFRAKGFGEFQFMLRVRNGVSRTYLHAAFSLEEEWREFVFRPDDFSGSSGFEWDDCDVREIVWKTYNSSSEIWLDEIRMHGLLLTDLLKRPGS
jgi:hypothetical protein